MAGLLSILKIYGKIVVNGATWVYDKENDKAVLESEFKKQKKKVKK